MCNTHVWGEDFDPARLLLASRVLKAERHSLLVSVPPLHLAPLERYHLILGVGEEKEIDTDQTLTCLLHILQSELMSFLTQDSLQEKVLYSSTVT